MTAEHDVGGGFMHAGRCEHVCGQAAGTLLPDQIAPILRLCGKLGPRRQVENGAGAAQREQRRRRQHSPEILADLNAE